MYNFDKKCKCGNEIPVEDIWMKFSDWVYSERDKAFDLLHPFFSKEELQCFHIKWDKLLKEADEEDNRRLLAYMEDKKRKDGIWLRRP